MFRKIFAGILCWLALASVAFAVPGASPPPLQLANAKLWVQNADPNNLIHWRRALASVRTGQGIGKVVFIGNSKTEGLNGASGNRQQSYPQYFANQLTKLGVPTQTNSVWGNSNWGGSANLSGSTIAGYSTYNSLLTWSNQTNWSVLTAAGSLGGGLINTSGSGGTMSFAPTGTTDQCDIWDVEGASNGTYNWNFNGGSNTAINSSIGTGYTKHTVSTTSGTNTLNIAYSSGGTIYFGGIACRLSTAPAVEIYNMGWGASVTTEWANSGHTYSPQIALSIVAPDLTFIALDTNDYTPAYGPTSLSAYATNLQLLVTVAKQTGDCAIIAEVPSASSRQTYAIQNQYHAVEAQIAASNSCVFFNVTQAWGGTYEQMNTQGFYSDMTHPTALGYNDWGAWIASQLLSFSM